MSKATWHRGEGVESSLLPLTHFNPKLRGLHDRRAETRHFASDCDSDGAKAPATTWAFARIVRL